MINTFYKNNNKSKESITHKTYNSIQKRLHGPKRKVIYRQGLNKSIVAVGKILWNASQP